MARSEARLQFGMWQQGLCGLSRDAKLLYAILLTEPTVNSAGVGAIRIDLWANNASMTSDEVREALNELGKEPQVIVDYETQEFLIRTLIRHEGIAEMPYVLKGALKAALQTASPMLRRALAAEVRRLPPKRPDGVSKAGKPVVYPDPHATAEQLDPSDPQTPQGGPRDRLERVSTPSQDAPAGEGSGKGFERVGGGGGGGSKGFSSVATHLPKSKPCAPQLVEAPPDPAVADAASDDAANDKHGDSHIPSKPSRGARIPDDFTVTPDMVAWARDHAPSLDGRIETEIFIDYWRAKPGKAATKLDWVLTWKNWFRREEQKAQQRATNRNHPGRPSVPTADRRIAEAELLKDNPNPAVLAAAGVPIPPRLKALPGGAA